MKRFAAAILGCVLFSGVAYGHHGIAVFDMNKDMTLNGTISRISFINPHSYIYVKVVDTNGAEAEWRCEMRAATVLHRSGWTEDMFKVGGQAKIVGSPAKDGTNTCYLGTITLADGTTMDRYGQLAHAEPLAPYEPSSRPKTLPNGDPNIAGTWAAEQFVMSDPKGQSGAFVPLHVAEKLKPGEVPAGDRPIAGARGTPQSFNKSPNARPKFPSPIKLTAAGEAAGKGYDPSSLKDNPRFHCASTNILADWTFEYDVNQVIQSAETITIKYGFMDIVRTIHMNMDKHPDNITPTLPGNSIGHWDNGVLVVDTVAFKPGVLNTMSGTMYSDKLHVVERFTPDLEKGSLTRTYVAEDPVYWQDKFTGKDVVYLTKTPYEEYKCDDRTWVPAGIKASN
jgi:hypothetical protein